MDSTCSRDVDRITTYINFARLMVERDLRIYRATRMSKFSAVAERMAQIKQEDDQIADELMVKIEEYVGRRTEVKARGHDHLTEKRADLEQMDRDLAQLSNALPIKGDGGDSGKN